MVYRADSELGALLTLLVLLGGVVGMVGSIVLLLSRRFRAAAKVLLVGDSYCMDIWCISIESVNTMPRGAEIVYKVDVRIFSDANTVKTSARGASVYLLDERGRRFELTNDPSVIPIDAPLSVSSWRASYRSRHCEHSPCSMLHAG